MAKQSAQEVWERSPGFVYFIAAGDPEVAVKIGISTEATLMERFNSIKGSNHEPLRIIGVISFRDSERPMKDAEIREKELHKEFKKFQCKGAGSEWFNTDPELKGYIKENATALKLTVPDSDKIWNKFQQDLNEDDRETVKRFHRDMVSSGYISVSKNTLQFRLIDKPDEPVVVIRIGTGCDMEIYLDHSKNTLIQRLIMEYVTLDDINSKLTERKFPRFKLNDWKKHSDEFLTAFGQIVKETN